MFETLKMGDTGDDVKILQEKLKMLGYYNAIITGNFQNATEVGVKAFQTKEGLPATGIVDQETWNKLNSYTEPTFRVVSNFPTISFGSTGNFVRDLQTKLQALLYYNGNLNGSFDLETENAVKRFQLNNELIATGVVNQETWSLLNTLYGNLNPCALDNENIEDSDNGNYYIVQKGDTLYAIAKRYNVTVSELKELNNLTSDTLEIGQVLKLPEEIENDNYIDYIVKPGDTLYSIAKKYQVTVDEIKNLNNLPNNVLRINQTLKIPTSSTLENDYTNYTVQQGDTLYSIAKRFDTNVDELKKLNNLTSNLLTLGQILKVPTNNQLNYETYVVQKGDTLYAIAKKYNTTIDEIKKLNNLDSAILNIGQNLKIPKKN